MFYWREKNCSTLFQMLPSPTVNFTINEELVYYSRMATLYIYAESLSCNFKNMLTLYATVHVVVFFIISISFMTVPVA